MFDISFSELLLIAVVALVVIGPERLPSVARTVGHLLGRLQRYVGDVKSDIQREMHLEELKKIQADIQHQASDIERSVVKEMQSVESTVTAQTQSLTEAMRETGHDLAATGNAAASALSDFDPAQLPPQSLPPASNKAVAGQPELPGMPPPSPTQDKAA